MDHHATDQDTTKAACLYMLERGLVNPIELERLSGRSRQIIRIWAKEHPKARDEYLARMWDRAVARTAKERPHL